MSVFNSNIPRKINFNSFVNNNQDNFNNNYYDNIPKIAVEISKFNPYDYENDNKYFDDYYEFKIRAKTNGNNENNKENFIFDNDFYNCYEQSGENFQGDHEKSDLLLKKISNYINDNNEDNLINNSIKNYDFKNNYSSPKLKKIKNNEYISQYSIKKPNKKQVCFTDLKDEPNNIKIRSTNYSSNLSFDNNNNNFNNQELYLYDINPLDENNINYNSKNSKIKMKNHKLDNITFVFSKNNKNKRNNHSSLFNNRNKENIVDKKQKKKLPALKSTIQYSKTLKTIDEYMEFKRNKSRPKKTNSKKRINSLEKKRNNISNIKSNINEFKQKEKGKPRNRESVKKLIVNNKKDNINDENNETQAVKLNKNIEKNNNNEEKKTISKKKEKIKSIPKVKSSKSFFKSFLCCFGYNNNVHNNDNDNENIKKTHTNKIKPTKTDIHNLVNDKKI